MAKKSRDQLILEDKLDAMRTRVAIQARQWMRRQRNELEAEIRAEHWKQVKAGKVRELGA